MAILIVAAKKPKQQGTDLTSASDLKRVSAPDVVMLITWKEIA